MATTPIVKEKPPDLHLTSSVSSPVKVIKKAKMTNGEGDNGSGPIRIESSRPEGSGCKVKQGLSFRDTIMGDATFFQDPWEDDGMALDNLEDDGEYDEDYPTVRVPKSENGRVRRAWACDAISQTLGKAFPYAFVVRRIQQLWDKKGAFHVWDIGFGHYVAKFMFTEDLDRALNDGPWLTGDHYPGNMEIPHPKLEEEFDNWMLAKKNARRKPKMAVESPVANSKATPDRGFNLFSVLFEDVVVSPTKEDEMKANTEANNSAFKTLQTLFKVLQGSVAIHRSKTVALVLLLISIFGYMLLLIANATIRERELHRALMKHMKATQQAELKSLNKTLGFATASHNIRTMLTPIFGFIEKWVADFPPTMARATNLKSIHDSTKDISSYLSHILDASKLEEGKMQLEEQEFNVVGVLEEMVDLCRPLAMRKDVVLLFDLSYFSILEFSHVKGDKGKLKQVLWKLVSNAVKYTAEGKIVVRARVQKPNSENVIVPSRWDGFSKWFSKIFSNGEKIPSVVQQNRMEFVFEVDDSGEGIPKDKQKSIFGSELGIVQSLVRLMGGEIGIVDKEEGQNGTCFRFSALLTVSDTNHNNKSDIELGNKITEVGKRSFYFELPIRTLVSDPPNFAPTSHVVLLIDDKARRRASRKLMESLGITVIIVEEWKQLQYVLMNIKPKLDPFNSSGRSNSSSMDGMDEIQTSSRMWSRFVLIVIDASAGPFQELHKAVTNFKMGLRFSSIKVVWLDKP
ncbi:Histidine kinase CKI1 [Linum perenne]